MSSEIDNPIKRVSSDLHLVRVIKSFVTARFEADLGEEPRVALVRVVDSDIVSVGVGRFPIVIFFLFFTQQFSGFVHL